ncbi:MAG: Rrf2 family transcriptional regulator [Aminobacterium sp.]|jgi:Rrf2 family protein|uniref:HTH-type transcriptional repressor NsrR n=1 Tax=bioreactor metagenome TaxID=1076179 RepID=A0A645GML0_9ZZZZ|nr:MULTISPECIES: Rrf2 family transcriptional regulator [unclassified Aminobacterium]MDD2206256.1 Rrf2 family transcriptional regulator [Aminobacterium sp.]MDD3425797.1 Rrf2 family transcriptional regulator [Aminobacterium sp.]MDD3707549.1 Rrf2 family transcriptional regulator [Aminobacterium sp.]MDD4229301.1 Rrf2 family transcriptional regulator [Aminobacterium sp.]MDD4552195.1 Rrf2 family transcriptional regulator [Aminobacterium sp.]
MHSIVSISEAASLAFHGMGLLAVTGKRMSIKEMAEIINVSEAHLAKVFQRLVKAGFVESSRGPGGGFELARSAESISLLEIYEEIEGKTEENYCLLHCEECPFHICIFGSLLQKMTQEFLGYLRDKLLSDLVRGEVYESYGEKEDY